MNRNRLLFAPDAAGDSSGAAAAEPEKAATETKAATEKTFSQAELNQIVNERLARASEKAKADAAKAQMDEATRLKTEKDEAVSASAAAIEAANRRVVAAEAKAQLAAAGVKPERLSYAVRILDLSAVVVGEDGEPDAAAVKKQVTALLADMPEFKGGGDAKGGQDFGQGTRSNPNDQPLSDAVITDMKPAEYTRRYPEIMEFYNSRKRPK